jgi:hypothetical protein
MYVLPFKKNDWFIFRELPRNCRFIDSINLISEANDLYRWFARKVDLQVLPAGREAMSVTGIP